MSNSYLLIIIAILILYIVCKPTGETEKQELTEQEIRVLITFIITIILVISLYVVITMMPMLLTEINTLRKDAFY